MSEQIYDQGLEKQANKLRENGKMLKSMGMLKEANEAFSNAERLGKEARKSNSSLASFDKANSLISQSSASASSAKGSISQRALETKLRNEAAKIPARTESANWLLENLCLSTPYDPEKSQKFTPIQGSSKAPTTNTLFSSKNVKEASVATGLGLSNFATPDSSGIDEYSKLLIKRTTAAYHAFSEKVDQPTDSASQGGSSGGGGGGGGGGGIGGSIGSFVGGVGGAAQKIKDYTEGASASLEDWSNTITPKLAEALKPNPLGGIVDTATGVVKDTMGAIQLLPNKIISLVDKVTPEFTNQIDSAFKAINLEGLAHLPSKVMGSLRNLATALDELLSVPFELLSDMYNGLLSIMNAIADLVDSLMSMVMNILQNLIFQILDSVLPITQIMSFLNSITEIASFLGDLSSMFGGFDVVTNITSQVTGFSSQISSALQNPLGTALSYVPGAQQGLGQITGGISQVTGALRNPQQLVNQFLPPGVSGQIKNISQFPGLGLVGNLGYSIGGAFDGLSDSFFTKTLSQFSSQLPILGPLFNKQIGSMPSLTNIASPGPDQFSTALINPIFQTGTGSTIQLEDTGLYKIFTEKT